MRVLVVDDDERLADLVKLELSQVSVETSISHAGATAITLASQEHFDAAIVDFDTPVQRLQKFKFRLWQQLQPGPPELFQAADTDAQQSIQCAKIQPRRGSKKEIREFKRGASLWDAPIS